MSDTTPCYVARCPECGGLVMVTMADLADREQVKRALRDCREAERDGLRIEYTTVERFRAMPFNHAEQCARGQMELARRAKKQLQKKSVSA